MKEKLTFTIGLIIICVSFNLMQNKAFAQGRYLIVLDIQEFHKKNKLQDSTVKEMVQNVNSLISHFDTAHIIYVKATGKALNISLKGFSVDTLPAPPFDNNLTIVGSNIFTKIEGDAFTSAELMSFLESRKAKEIVLVGLMAEKCIYNTALGGKSRSYDIIIVTEAIVGTTPKKKETAINEMKEKGIKFIPISDITKVP
jgi:nicotinamidase-related amidase